MTTTVPAVARWYTAEYLRIESARFEVETALLTVTFADGDQARLDPTPLVPSSLQDVDWSFVAWNEHIIVVPHASGWFEIPWDVIRARTDPEFDAHMSGTDHEQP